MSRTSTILIQGALATAQAINLECGKMYPTYAGISIIVSILLGGASTTFAAIAHSYNPDGTSAQGAYTK